MRYNSRPSFVAGLGKPRSARLLLGLMLCLLCCWPDSAQAASEADGRVLVLDVRVGSKSDAVLRQRLIEWLRGRDLPVGAAAEVSAEFDTCAKTACLRALALRAGARQVLTAQINEPNHVIAFWLFDVRSGLQHQVLEEWGHGSGFWASLTQTSELLLRLPPDSSADGFGLSGHFRRLPPWRVALSSGLGALGILGLTVAIGAASKHGDLGPVACASGGAERACFYDMQPLFGPTFALAAASLTGAVLTLSLPSRRRSASKETQP